MTDNVPSAKYLTYPYPVFLGCTLQEVAAIICFYMIVNIILSAALSLLWHAFFLFFVAFFLLSIWFIRYTCYRFGKFKLKLQPGFFSMKLWQILANYFPINSPYTVRRGKWLARGERLYD